MSYDKQTWINEPSVDTPLSAARFNFMEAGIEAAAATADAAAAAAAGKADLLGGTVPDAQLPGASTTAKGIVEFATNAETTTGTDATRAVTPAGLKIELDKKPSLSGVEGVKVHDGTTGGGVRPTGYSRVRWTGGTARPTNMAAGDIWEHDA